MKRFLGVMAVIALASFVGAPARALELKHGVELQGGIGRWDWEDEPTFAGSELRWGGGFGAGYFVETKLPAGLLLGAGLGYARTGDEIRSTLDLGAGAVTSKYRMRAQQLVIPLRLAHAIPGAPRLSFELGGLAEYVLIAENRITSSESEGARPARSYAKIFEDLGDWYDVTGDVSRLVALGSVGAGWHMKLFGHDAALGARYEHGFTPLWDQEDTDFDRFARRFTGTLRWTF